MPQIYFMTSTNYELIHFDFLLGMKLTRASKKAAHDQWLKKKYDFFLWTPFVCIVFYSLFLVGTPLLLKIGWLTLSVGKSNMKYLQSMQIKKQRQNKTSPTDIFLRIQNVHKHKDDRTKIIMFTDLWRLWFEAKSSASEYYKSEIVAITDQPVCPRPGYENRIEHQLVSRQRKGEKTAQAQGEP